jgi:hypothetical protein
MPSKVFVQIWQSRLRIKCVAEKMPPSAGLAWRLRFQNGAEVFQVVEQERRAWHTLNLYSSQSIY